MHKRKTVEHPEVSLYFISSILWNFEIIFCLILWFEYEFLIHFFSWLHIHHRFLEIVNCVVSFIWETEAACAISKTEDSAEKNCEVMDPNSKFIFNLMPLQENSNNPYLVRGTDNFEYEVNLTSSFVFYSHLCKCSFFNIHFLMSSSTYAAKWTNAEKALADAEKLFQIPTSITKSTITHNRCTLMMVSLLCIMHLTGRGSLWNCILQLWILTVQYLIFIHGIHEIHYLT